MVGADEDAYALVKPVFKKWASMVVPCRRAGRGGDPDEAGPKHADVHRFRGSV